MDNLKLEKSIKKLDRDMEALKIASKYLSNKDEIEKVRKDLNDKRQKMANEYYYNDGNSYIECCKIIREYMDRELNEEEQKELLERIRGVYNRMAPNVSKEGKGLNAWLKEIGAVYQWGDLDERGWSTLKITSLISKYQEY